MNRRRTLCVIPARGGSKRIPRKNIIEFFGKPLIAYSIEAIKEANIADTIMVSTDDYEIADVAKNFGAEVPFFRKKELANDNVGIAEVLVEVLNQYKNKGEEYDYLICLLAAAPLIQKSNLIKAYEMLIGSEDIDSVCPVEAFSYPPQRSLIVKNGRLEMLYPNNYHMRSQDLEVQYHDCGQFFMFKTKAFLQEQKLYLQNSVPLYLDKLESQDIDNYDDLEMAKLKYKILMARRMTI